MRPLRPKRKTIPPLVPVFPGSGALGFRMEETEQRREESEENSSCGVVLHRFKIDPPAIFRRLIGGIQHPGGIIGQSEV